MTGQLGHWVKPLLGLWIERTPSPQSGGPNHLCSLQEINVMGTHRGDEVLAFVSGEHCFVLFLGLSFRQHQSPPSPGCEGPWRFRAWPSDPGSSSSTDRTSPVPPVCTVCVGTWFFVIQLGLLTLTRWKMNQFYHKIPSHFTIRKMRPTLQLSLKITITYCMPGTVQSLILVNEAGGQHSCSCSPSGYHSFPVLSDASMCKGLGMWGGGVWGLCTASWLLWTFRLMCYLWRWVWGSRRRFESHRQDG